MLFAFSGSVLVYQATDQLIKREKEHDTFTLFYLTTAIYNNLKVNLIFKNIF